VPRLILLTIALLALVAPATASAATYTYDVPDLVGRPLAAIKQISTIDVLLPAKMTTDFRRLYSVGEGRRNSYRFQIGATRNCRGAGACFVAELRGRRGAKPSNPRKVTLRGGRRGWFRPLRCGASCAAPSLEWVRRGVLYTIEAKLGTRSTDRRILTRLANSALRNGPR
jgi:hypothetical protein